MFYRLDWHEKIFHKAFAWINMKIKCKDKSFQWCFSCLTGRFLSECKQCKDIYTHYIFDELLFCCKTLDFQVQNVTGSLI